MPKKPIKKILAWSYSRYSTYVTCALMAKFKFIDRLKEPASPPLLRGSEIHKKAEDYSLGRIKKLPKELELFEEEFKDLQKRRKTLRVEVQLAVDRDWEPCDWFAKSAWLRGVLDAMYVDNDILVIVDHKTGKIRAEQMEQLELYAILGFIFGPEHIKKVRCEFWYLDQGEIKDKSFTRAQALKLRAKWERKTKKMLADTAFHPKPNDKCKWCWFGQSGKKKGGPGLCKY